MKTRMRILTSVSALLMLANFGTVVASQTTNSPEPACDVTRPNGKGTFREQPSPGLYGNGALSMAPWTDGTVVFKPGGPGFVMQDGSLGMKWGWRRGVRGQLKIEGRRVDAPAPPLQSEIACCGYGDIGFQSTYLIFPTPGCWEVTGRVGEASLTFVTLVVQIGAGPSPLGPLPALCGTSVNCYNPPRAR